MRILAINDKLNSLENIANLIKAVDPTATVTVLNSINEAIDFAMSNKVDVVFLNALFDSVSGLDIAFRLSEKNPSLNVIFYNKEAVLMREAFAARASGYMICPITQEMIRNEMTNLRYAV